MITAVTLKSGFSKKKNLLLSIHHCIHHCNSLLHMTYMTFFILLFHKISVQILHQIYEQEKARVGLKEATLKCVIE